MVLSVVYNHHGIYYDTSIGTPSTSNSSLKSTILKPVPHLIIMDDLEEFLSQQKALAEMPEGDIEDYEDRMRLRAKRSGRF